MQTKEEVLAIAELGNLKLSDAEVDKFSSQLSAVLDMFKTIDDVDLKETQETSQVTGLNNVLRQDEIQCEKECTCCTTEELLGNVPNRDENLIIVPKILERK